MKFRIIGSIIAALVIFVAVIFGQQRNFFRAPIVDKFELAQVPFESTYNINIGSDIIVPNVFGWVVTQKWLIGSFGSEQYFAINRSSGSKQLFSGLRPFNEFLIAHGFNRYTMSDEENVAHLKYHNGKNRKYGKPTL